MRHRKPMDWFPVWIDKWLFGSTRLELTHTQRALWLDLLALSAKDKGYIRANETTPYPLKQLAGFLMVDEKTLAETIERCIQVGKLERLENDILRVTKFDEFQLSDRWKREIKKKVKRTSKKTEKISPKKEASLHERKMTSEKTEHTSEKAEHISEKTEHTSRQEEVYSTKIEKSTEKKESYVESPNGDSLHFDSALDESKDSSRLSQSVDVEKQVFDIDTTEKISPDEKKQHLPPHPCVKIEKMFSQTSASEEEEDEKTPSSLEEYFNKRLVNRFAEAQNEQIAKAGASLLGKTRYQDMLIALAMYMKKHIQETTHRKLTSFSNQDKERTWIKHTVIALDMLCRRDGIHLKEIKRVIDWVYDDNFWCKVILSGKNLRENYDRIVLAMEERDDE